MGKDASSLSLNLWFSDILNGKCLKRPLKIKDYATQLSEHGGSKMPKNKQVILKVNFPNPQITPDKSFKLNK